MSICPCGSGLELDACCGPYIKGAAVPTAEALLRARYTAHVIKDIAYIEKTCMGEARKEYSQEATEESLKNSEWLGLEIHDVQGGLAQDAAGTIHFTFRYKYKGQECAQTEIAKFEKENNVWLYRDSELNPHEKPARVEHVGRNDPCTCGSGKKYKKCCGA